MVQLWDLPAGPANSRTGVAFGCFGPNAAFDTQLIDLTSRSLPYRAGRLATICRTPGWGLAKRQLLSR
jgi:hypothetical protein